MHSLLAYCRPGYEADTGNELTDIATNRNRYGYPALTPGQGYVEFHFYAEGDADALAKSVPVSDTIFPRQIVVCSAKREAIDKNDRISPILEDVSDLCESIKAKLGNVVVEYADTEDGKVLAKFCRKFSVPLRQALRNKGLLSAKENTDKPQLHVFFTDFDSYYLGYSLPQCRSVHVNGICRLKFPPDAPSRSTLKLEEAIREMVHQTYQDDMFREGARAVDLGACPGGWTYQLVQRQMFVEAVDNGLIDDKLMASGLVEHYAEDGFVYKPQFGRVELLVCDMIEQPDRVTQLMGEWLVNGRTNHVIYNLKLPMKRRYETVTAARQHLLAMLEKAGIKVNIQIRHLYHDRDEVTAVVLQKL